MARPREPLFWFDTERFHAGAVWRVYLAHDGLMPILDGLCGVCFFETREVYINVRYSKREQDVTVYHELTHAGALGTEWPNSRVEERLVLRLERNLWPTLQRHGLRWPDRPEGYEALRRQARRLPQ